MRRRRYMAGMIHHGYQTVVDGLKDAFPTLGRVVNSLPLRSPQPDRRRRWKRSLTAESLQCEVLESRLCLSGVPVLDWNFSQTATGQPTVNGAGINSGGDYFPTNLRDDANSVGPGQSLGYLGAHGTYLVGAAIPNQPVILPAGWDGGAVRFNGGNYARFADDVLAFSGSFSAWARIYREGYQPATTDLLEYVIGGAQPNNGGWGIYLDRPSNKLDVNLGGAFRVPNSQLGAFAGNGPVIADNTWYDIGISYSGTPGDGISDTLKVFLNGSLLQTFTGDADFDAKPFGFSFAIGMDSFGNEGFKGLFERVMLWNGAVDDATMAALSAPSGPPVLDVNLDFDGSDEPFYTTPGTGATLTLAQVNTILDTGGIPLTVGGHAAGWQLTDASSDHFLLGPLSAGGADFYGNFVDGTAATRIAANLGYYTSSATATLTAYAQPITDASAAGLTGLTVIGTQVRTINGTTQHLFDFDLSLANNVRSFSIEISGNTTGPAVNRLSWDTIALPPDPGPPEPEPTDVGEWHQFRGNGRLTGRSELEGSVINPQIIWSKFIGSRETWTALTLDGSSNGTGALPNANQGISQSELVAWQVGGPYYDLDGTGVLTAITPWVYYKYGDFLPAIPGLERVEVSLDAAGDGTARLYRRQGGAWSQVWQSATIPQLQLGPNVIVGDFDDDGQLEMATTAWYSVFVLNMATGAIEKSGNFNPPGSESGRPYGWHGAFDLNNDGKDEFVVLGDFENKIGVVGYNASGNLTTLWTRLIESSPVDKQTVHHPGVDPVQDITGDGVPEIVTSIFNESGDQKWHVMAFNGMTGAVVLNLPDHYLAGLRDTDGDGVAELFTVVAPAANGGRPPETGHVKLMSYEGSVLTTRWEQFDVAFQTADVQDFPLNVSSGAATLRLTILVGSIAPGDAKPAFFTRKVIDDANDMFEVTAWQSNAAGVVSSLGKVSGPNLSVIATRASGAGMPDILARTEIPGDVPGQISYAGFATSTAYSARIGPPQTSAVVGRLDETSNQPTVIVQTSAEKLTAFQTNNLTGTITTLWTRDGRGEFTGGDNFTGQPGFGNVSLGDILGNGTLATVAATRGPDGQARLVAIAPDGSEIWHHDFDKYLGAPPIWNVAGLTTWKLGNFRTAEHQDVLVSLRRSTFHNDSYFLIDGQTGEIVWTRDWGNTPGTGTHQRGAGGSQLAVYDWDGIDGLDEAVNIYPDVFYAVDGDGDNVVDRNLILTEYGSIWPQGGIPIVDDFLDNNTLTILHPGSLNVVGLLDKTGDAIWYKGGSYSQFSPAVGDFDGNGDLEFFLDGKAYDAKTGAIIWTPASVPTSHSPGVSADIDGDGRDEIIVTSGGTLYVIGGSAAGTSGQIEWTKNLGGSLGMPIVADSDGDGQIEILVVSTNGNIYSVGQLVLPGDVNFDHVVDIFDVNLVSSNWGQAGPTADANRDGIVNIFDINLISSHWSGAPLGQGSGLRTPAQSVASTDEPVIASSMGTSSQSTNSFEPIALNVVAGRFGATANGPTEGDLNSDGVVNIFDVNAFSASQALSRYSMEAATQSRAATRSQDLHDQRADDSAHSLLREIDGAFSQLADENEASDELLHTGNVRWQSPGRLQIRTTASIAGSHSRTRAR